MTRVDGHGECEHCHHKFPYYLIHNGFNDSFYAYCDRCGRTALISSWVFVKERRLTEEQQRNLPQGQIARRLEADLSSCECGGRFLAGASPRCPACNEVLSPERAAEWIEANASGAKKGWRWQRSWSGLYCIVVNGLSVSDNIAKV
jgi:hypothetical protein